MDAHEAELILLQAAADDMTGLERALVVVVNSLQDRLKEAESRIQTLVDNTGTWRAFR